MDSRSWVLTFRVGRVTPHGSSDFSFYSQGMNKDPFSLFQKTKATRQTKPTPVAKENGTNERTSIPPAKASTDGVVESPKMYETENDISKSRRCELNTLMNQRLADAVDLQMQMKQAHWNVKGPSFIAMHELFDQVDEAIESYVDMIAERIVQLGGIAEGTVRVAASRTRLEEYPLAIAEGSLHVEAVAKALSTFGRESRNTIIQAEELGDAATADLFTEIVRGADKWLWFVEAHSQASK